MAARGVGTFRSSSRYLQILCFLDGRKIRAKLHLEKPPRFLLTTRGFHWINGRPLSR